MAPFLISLQDRPKWEEALRGLRHGFGHGWESCNAFAHSQGHAVCLYVVESPSGRAAMPLLMRSFKGLPDVTTPFGYTGIAAMGDTSGFREAWAGFAREQGWVAAYALQNPLVEFRDCWAEEHVHVEGSLHWLDLRNSAEELFSSFSRCRRRQIRKWQGQSNWLTEDRDEILEFFLREANGFYAGKGASSLYSLADETWRLLCGSRNVLVLGARRDGRIVAATLFGEGAGLADALFNISLPEGRDAATILMWEGARRLAGRGVEFLNMGGGVTENDSVEQSKRRFNSMVTPLIRIKQVFDRPAYGRLCRSTGHDPDKVSGYFPPYHRAAVRGGREASIPSDAPSSARRN